MRVYTTNIQQVCIEMDEARAVTGLPGPLKRTIDNVLVRSPDPRSCTVPFSRVSTTERELLSHHHHHRCSTTRDSTYVEQLGPHVRLGHSHICSLTHSLLYRFVQSHCPENYSLKFDWQICE